jgi:hypothetical protein
MKQNDALSYKPICFLSLLISDGGQARGNKIALPIGGQIGQEIEMKNAFGTIKITRQQQSDYLGATQFKFRNRYYTAFGRLFIVAGRYTEEDYQKCCDMKHYRLSNMNIVESDGQPGLMFS